MISFETDFSFILMYHAYYHSPIGLLKISGDEDGIASIYFMEEDEKTQGNTEVVLPAHIAIALKQLGEYFSGKRKNFSLKLNPHGTTFQQQVWQQLLKIPYGKTITYTAIARALGDEKKNRAVGLANGKNPLGIVIPCHRVNGADGSLVGYAGGLHRKKWLLQHEAGIANEDLFTPPQNQ